MGSQLFRDRLGVLLEQRRMSAPGLAAVTWYTRGYVWEVMSGRKRPALEFAEACDRALRAGGNLITALLAADPDTDRPGGADAAGAGQVGAVAGRGPEHGPHEAPGAAPGADAPDEDGLQLTAPGSDAGMGRRQVLLDLGLLGIAGPLAATESVRHGLGVALHGEADVAEWDEIADEYANAYYRTPPASLLPDLTAHLDALGRQITVADGPVARDLSRAGGQLAGIMAITLAATGEVRRARRWWRVARLAADRSGDRHAQAWVRGWEAVDGLYEARPVPEILDHAAESTALLGDVVCVGTAQLHAGLAQTLAVAGRREEALAALGRVADLTERIPTEGAPRDTSLSTWTEVRLRHTESYVYTWLGNGREAYAAQERALRLYGTVASPRQPSQVRLHRAGCMLRDGDVSGGLAYASSVLDGLPAEHHTNHVYAVGRRALTLLPERERDRPDAVELRERLATIAA